MDPRFAELFRVSPNTHHNGYSGTVYHPGAKDGDILCTYGWYDTPAYAPAGTLYFQAYDEAGNLLVSASVRVTS